MPDFASTLVFNVISALVLALIGVITKTLLPYLKAKKDEALTALAHTKWSWAVDVVSAVVLAVEQTAEEYMHGEVKKDTATRLITDFFRQNGIELTTEQISTLIETAVKQMNSNVIEVSDYNTNTEAVGFDTGEVPADVERD